MQNFIQKIEECDVTIPILDIGDRTGRTDYIDFIGIDDMSYPIMKGMDVHLRPFLALKVHFAFYEPVKDVSVNTENVNTEDVNAEDVNAEDVNAEEDSSSRSTSFLGTIYKYSHVLTHTREMVGTFFQRYKTGSSVYAEDVISYGTCYHPGLLYGGGCLTLDSYNNMLHTITSLCSGHSVIIERSDEIRVMTMPMMKKKTADVLRPCLAADAWTDLVMEFV